MSKKGDARVARKLANDLKTRAKSARLIVEPEAHMVRSEYVKDIKREARAGANPGSIYQLRVTWTCDSADRTGAWTSGTSREWGEQVWAQDIEPKLTEFSMLTWAEVERMVSDTGHRMHHSMETERLSEEAQYRLIEIDQESEVIYRFRLGNLPRLWGFRNLGQFSILWYDPKHEVYPVG